MSENYFMLPVLTRQMPTIVSLFRENIKDTGSFSSVDNFTNILFFQIDWITIHGCLPSCLSLCFQLYISKEMHLSPTSMMLNRPSYEQCKANIKNTVNLCT